MTRQDLGNHAPKSKARRALKLSTVLTVAAIMLLLVLLYQTSPARTHPECARGTDVPRYCVD